jgi:hypothetical protein
MKAFTVFFIALHCGFLLLPFQLRSGLCACKAQLPDPTIICDSFLLACSENASLDVAEAADNRRGCNIDF